MRYLFSQHVTAALLFFMAARICLAGPATQPVSYREEIRDNPKEHLHIATIDLTDPRVVVKVVRGGDDPDGNGPWQTTLATVRAMANAHHLDVAVNGNFFNSKDSVKIFGRNDPYFTGNWGMVAGLAMSDGVLWGTDPWPGVLVVDSRGHITIGQLAKLPLDARQVVSGASVFLNQGKNSGRALDLAPRTAVGINRDANVLTLLVVDGRRPEYSVGITEAQCADELIHLGCWNGILLDGGGSSTMVYRDPSEQAAKLVSHPSDGHDLPLSLSVERPVACALGVMVKDDPTTQP